MKQYNQNTPVYSSVILRELGNSLIITIPKEILDKMEWEKGTELQLSTDSRGTTLVVQEK